MALNPKGAGAPLPMSPGRRSDPAAPANRHVRRARGMFYSREWDFTKSSSSSAWQYASPVQVSAQP